MLASRVHAKLATAGVTPIVDHKLADQITELLDSHNNKCVTQTGKNRD
jgi:hypothetical protein